MNSDHERNYAENVQKIDMSYGTFFIYFLLYAQILFFKKRCCININCHKVHMHEIMMTIMMFVIKTLILCTKLSYWNLSINGPILEFQNQFKNLLISCF